MFWSLGSFEDLPKEAGEVWRMQSGILQDPESYTRHGAKKLCWSKRLDNLGTLGRLGLEGIFVYLNLLSNGSILLLGGQRRDFLLSSSVSSLITHHRVILYMHSSFLLFYFSFYCCVIMIMG